MAHAPADTGDLGCGRASPSVTAWVTRWTTPSTAGSSPTGDGRPSTPPPRSSPASAITGSSGRSRLGGGPGAPGAGRRRAIRDLAIAGISSSLVNAAVKSAVGRARPDRTAVAFRAEQVPVREPTSSSFPSGHTLAAFCTATVMADGRRPVASAARFAAAGLVGLSRLHLRAHHASDVLGGMAVGMALGAVGRTLR